MRIAVTTILLLVAGCLIGGRVAILEYLYECVWHNPLGERIHEAILSVDDNRLTDLYAGLRMDFRYGVLALLFGLMTAILIPSRCALLPCVLVLGVMVGMWVPLLIELAAKGRLASVPEFIPDFVWDVALLPTCGLGIGIARLLRLRRFPRWRIKDATLFTLLVALFLAAILQRSSLLFPTTFSGLVLFLSFWLLRQSDTILGTPMHGSGKVERDSNEESTVGAL